MKQNYAAVYLALLIALTLAEAQLSLVAKANPLYILPTIVIKSNGSIEPETDFIKQIGNTYYLTSSLSGKYAFKVECSNIIFNGAGHTVDGTSSSSGYYADNEGLNLAGVTNVTVRDLEIVGFRDYDIAVENSISCVIQRIKTKTLILENSGSNVVNESSLAGNDANVQTGVQLNSANNNKFYGNSINGIILVGSSYNVFFQNNIIFQHTSVFGGSAGNLWDNRSVGNYWSDYLTKYPTASQIGNTGIGDTSYVIDANNRDNYPLMARVKVPEPLPSNIDFVAPTVSVQSPENKSYTTRSVLLNFSLSEPASKIEYCLDGSDKVTVSESTTLTVLTNGDHNLTVYATDETGNVGISETVYFSVEAPEVQETFPTTIVVVASGVSAIIIAVGIVAYVRRRRRQVTSVNLS